MKDDILYGVAIALVAALLGTYLFVTIFTEYTFFAGVQILQMQGQLGKLIVLGAMLDLVAFFGLLYLHKDQMAKGVLYGTIALGLLTFFL